MQYQQIIHKVDGVYSLYRIERLAGGKSYCCLICGRLIRKRAVVYYKSPNLHLCSDCLAKTRRPNKYRIPRI